MAGTTCVLHAQLTNIQKAALLSWPEPSQEQTVVGSGSLTGPVWTPWPEPIYKRFGQLCMAVPTTASQQFFELAPGWQFADDFSGPNPGWVPWFQQAGEEWTVTNGILRFDWNAPTNLPGFALFARGATNAEAVLRNVNMSVDLLDCVTSTTNLAVLALGARATVGPTGGFAYFGGLSVNYGGVRGIARPWIYGDDYIYTYGATINLQDYPLPYRLQFSVVGNSLRLRVLHLATGQFIGGEVNAPGSDYPTGPTALWFNGRVNPGDTFTIIADNFFLSGTKP